MEKLADALVYAVSYINCRDEDGDETYLDEDVKALEWLAHILRQTTDAEQDALAAAAKRAVMAELAAGAPADAKWVQDYSNWMQEMFVDGWVGNDRAPSRKGGKTRKRRS